MTYSFIMGEDFATLVNVATGNTVCLNKSDTNYDTFVSYLKARDYVKAEGLADAKMAFEAFVGTETSGLVSFIVKDGGAFYKFGAMDPVPLHNSITDRILAQAEQGFDVKPMMKFMANLLSNPEKSAVDELYLFLEACKLPITEDGCFIAYKIVKGNYQDIYTGTMDNSVGKIVEMDRTKVDTNRHNTCSVGLHFCSKEYLNHYGSGNRSDDRCMLVKINPADVVSIPADYNNAKGRAWKYEVVGEVTDKEWRRVLPTTDYTSDAVVAPNALQSTLKKLSIEDTFDRFFGIEDGYIVWDDTGNEASRSQVFKRLERYSSGTPEEINKFIDDILYPEDDIVDDLVNEKAGVSLRLVVENENRAWDHLDRLGFNYDGKNGVWMDLNTPVSVKTVSDISGYTVEELNNLVS